MIGMTVDGVNPTFLGINDVGHGWSPAGRRTGGREYACRTLISGLEAHLCALARGYKTTVGNRGQDALPTTGLGLHGKSVISDSSY